MDNSEATVEIDSFHIESMGKTIPTTIGKNSNRFNMLIADLNFVDAGKLMLYLYNQSVDVITEDYIMDGIVKLDIRNPETNEHPDFKLECITDTILKPGSVGYYIFFNIKP